MDDDILVTLTRRQAQLYLDDGEYYQATEDANHRALYGAVSGARWSSTGVILTLSPAMARDLLTEYEYIAGALTDRSSGDPAARAQVQVANNAYARLKEAGAETITEFDERVAAETYDAQ